MIMRNGHNPRVMTQSLIENCRCSQVNTFIPNKLETTYSLELDPNVKLKHLDFMRRPEKGGVMKCHIAVSQTAQ